LLLHQVPLYSLLFDPKSVRYFREVLALGVKFARAPLVLAKVVNCVADGNSVPPA
jgi:hypothetical protein